MTVMTKPCIIYSFFHAIGLSIQILLRIAIDIDVTLFVALGNGSLGGKLDRIALHACGAIFGAAVDANIAAVVVNGHIAMEIADLADYFHISDGGIGETLIIIVVNFLQQIGLGFRRQRCIALHLLSHLFLHLICHVNGAFFVAGEGVIHQEVGRCLSVGWAVDFVEVCSAFLLDIDAVDLGVALVRVRRNSIFLIIDNLAALLAHEDIVQPQVGIRLVRDGDAGGGIGAKVPRTDKVVGHHIDIATAGGDIRDLHIKDRPTVTCIDVVASGILHRQPQMLHVFLNPLTLGDIGR